ncbi:hypothetical protein [Rhizobium halophytocola]|uniref:Uncharacterized protein n=1 Tax=Rhizobium halophytocola TaxID=735519 RepID=A0ABS4E5I6_9HYPH|nr:hypothetical protein [Rhizobium halophytocola]MBP1853183.1 hypothetical protein [Rhizobium halophytocola]
MTSHNRKPRAIAIAKAEAQQTAQMQILAVISIGAVAAIAALAFMIAG